MNRRDFDRMVRTWTVAIIVLLVIGLWVAFCLSLFALFSPAHGKDKIIQYDPSVLQAHLHRFGELRYMTHKELRAVLREIYKASRGKLLLSEEIVSMASRYNEKRFLYEILEDFCRVRR